MFCITKPSSKLVYSETLKLSRGVQGQWKQYVAVARSNTNLQELLHVFKGIMYVTFKEKMNEWEREKGEIFLK